MKTFFTAVVLSLVSLFSCQPDSAIKTVGVEEFAQIIQDDAVQLLDVRTPEEYAEGHIKGFTMIDVKADDFADKVDEMLVKDQARCRILSWWSSQSHGCRYSCKERL